MPRHPNASRHAASLSDTVYSSLLARAQTRPGPVHALHVGDTWLDPLPAARAEAQRTEDHPRLHNYAPVQGEPALLDAITASLSARGHAVDRESLQVMSGATGGLSVVASALFDPDDEVIVLAPYWPLIRGIVASRGALPVEVPFYDRAEQPGFDAEAVLEAAVTPRTVALYLNTPNNPTGRVLNEAALDAIAAVAQRHQLWLLTDEAYEALAYVETPPPLWMRPALVDRVIANHTFSKTYGLAGARVGFTHGPQDVMRAIRGTQTFLTYCAPRPMQLGAARALTEGDEWLDRARALYRDAGTRAAAALGLPPPQGGTFLFIDAAPFFRDGETVTDFLERALDAGVLLTPGGASGSAYQSFVRLCFTTVPPAELDDAVRRLAPLTGR